MKIEYRRLTENELEIFIEMRINQLLEEGAQEDIDLKPALKDYSIRYGGVALFGFWICKEWELHAVQTIDTIN